MPKKLNINKLSKQEFEDAVASGDLVVVPVEKKAPVIPNPLPTTVSQSTSQLDKVADATNKVAESLQQASMEQSSAMINAMQQVSDALRMMADKPSWQHIRIELDHDRNDRIRSADLKKIL